MTQQRKKKELHATIIWQQDKPILSNIYWLLPRFHFEGSALTSGAPLWKSLVLGKGKEGYKLTEGRPFWAAAVFGHILPH